MSLGNPIIHVHLTDSNGVPLSINAGDVQRLAISFVGSGWEPLHGPGGCYRDGDTDDVVRFDTNWGPTAALQNYLDSLNAPSEFMSIDFLLGDDWVAVGIDRSRFSIMHGTKITLVSDGVRVLDVNPLIVAVYKPLVNAFGHFRITAKHVV